MAPHLLRWAGIQRLGRPFHIWMLHFARGHVLSDSEPSADSLHVVAGAPPQPTVWYTQSELAIAAAAAGEPGWSAAQLQQLERLVELARRGEPFSVEYEMPREMPFTPEELARQLACIFSSKAESAVFKQVDALLKA